MDILTLLISRVNDVLWTYILIIMLLGCAFWFTFKTNFVQFRMIREMIRLLGDSTGKTEGREHHISSFQAFAVSIASRIGTGNGSPDKPGGLSIQLCKSEKKEFYIRYSS